MDHKFKFFTSMIFSKNVFKSVLGKQRFKTPEPQNGLYLDGTYTFNISESYLKEWNDFLETGDNETMIPYTYYWPWLMDWLMKVLLPGTGVNLRNVLHMGHDATFYPGYEKMRSGKHVLKNRLVDLCPLSKNKIDMVTETVIETGDGECLFKVTDHTIVLNLKDEDMQLLRESEAWDHADVPFRHDSFRKKEALFADSEGCGIRSYYLKPDIASVFGRVAGALSLTHATKLTAKIFRKGKTFVQGMCTGNIVLKVLCGELGEVPGRFEVYFTNHLSFPQQVEVRFNDTRFEVFDEANVMVAYGHRFLRDAKDVVAEEKKVA